MLNQIPENQTGFKPERISRSATITIHARIDKVFPLLGPIREKDWAAGWEPEVIFSTTNDVEEHMVFQMKSPRGEGERYLWVINQYRPKEYLIEYTVSTSQRMWFITVKCRPANNLTKATITYTYIGLTGEGNLLNKKALEKMFSNDLKDWEEAINYYLRTGKQKQEHIKEPANRNLKL